MLRTQAWKPDDNSKAAIVLTHGHGEHSGRYGHVGQALCAEGYAVYAYDLRGHGKSSGPRGHAPSYESLLDDLQFVYDWVKKENPGQEIFLYGHSLGGQITLNFVLRRKPDPAGVIVSAPWLRLTYMPPAWKVRLAQTLANLWPAFTQNTGLDKAVPMSHDQALLSSFPDLNLTHARISARLGFAALSAGEEALACAAEFNSPILLLHGDEDNAMSPAGSQLFYERAATPDKTYRHYPEMYHEIHNETGRAQVLRDILNWLDQR
jgi:alpha-beta hydrolase superfamily lysophospholipase